MPPQILVKIAILAAHVPEMYLCQPDSDQSVPQSQNMVSTKWIICQAFPANVRIRRRQPSYESDK